MVPWSWLLPVSKQKLVLVATRERYSVPATQINQLVSLSAPVTDNTIDIATYLQLPASLYSTKL